MNQARRARILIVEDDPTARMLVKRILGTKGLYDLDVASDGETGLQKAREFHPDLIISDYMMPGMDGMELCRAIKADDAFGNPIFMILTAMNESDRKTQGLEGGADEYISKPPIADDFVPKVNAFLRIKRLQDQLRADKKELELLNARLEQSFLDLVRLVTRLIDIRVPGAHEKGNRSAKVSVWIAQKLLLADDVIRDLELAAHLREVGKIGIPEQVSRKHTFELEPEEWPVFARHPVFAEMTTMEVERLRNVGLILRHQLENVDGTGYPDHLVGDEIPLPSRILRCIAGYEDFRKSIPQSTSHRDAISTLQVEHHGVFDPAILQLLAEYLTTTEDTAWLADKIAVSVVELADGMKLAADLITSSGVKLLPTGAKLTSRMVEHIQNHHANDPIIASVIVWRGSSSEMS